MSKSDRKNCCNNGKLLTSSYFPELHYLPLELASILLDNTEHMARACVYYNNMFQLASIAVDNGRPNPGFEKFKGGVGAVLVNGRTQLYFKSTTYAQCGLNYFTYDANMTLQQHVNSINGKTERTTVSMSIAQSKQVYFNLY